MKIHAIPKEPAMSDAAIQTVKNIYAAFGRGEVDAILAVLADDVEWHDIDHPAVPYGGRRRGKPAVREFFRQVGQVEVSSFEPLEYVSAGDRVFAIGRWAGTVKPTGKSFTSEWVMIWTFKEGKVTHFRVYEDSAAVAAAFSR
jgi:ketosteroid isomerase-like protein